MSIQQKPIDTLQDIKRIMERSSRFISLSGLSGIAAGICALVGAYFAYQKIHCWVKGNCELEGVMGIGGKSLLHQLLLIATLTLIASLISAFLFTYLRSKKDKIPMWGNSSMRLLANVLIPIIVGGLYLIKMMQLGQYQLVAPGCLIFYGLALVNSSKYTLDEIRYLGYVQIILGLINLWLVGYGLQFWALGFGIFHIIYGIVMWYKYERN